MTTLSRTHRLASLALASALLLPIGACSDDESGSTPSTTTRSSEEPPVGSRQPALEGTISVVAADSLSEALPELVQSFNAIYPDVEVTTRFDSTPVLAMELLDGAVADVFISGDQANMQVLVDGGRTDGPPRPLAGNRLVIVTPAGNPDEIAALADLAGADAVALCDSGTPCGALADDAIEAGGIDLDGVERVDTGSDAVVAVVDGDVEAALVFESSALAAGAEVAVVEPTDVDVVSTFTIATLAPGLNALAARSFMDHVRSSDGIDILVRYGFVPPA